MIRYIFQMLSPKKISFKFVIQNCVRLLYTSNGKSEVQERNLGQVEPLAHQQNPRNSSGILCADFISAQWSQKSTDFYAELFAPISADFSFSIKYFAT